MTFDDDEGEKSELVRIVEDSFARLVNAMFAWFDTLGEVCVCVWLFVCCVCVCVCVCCWFVSFILLVFVCFVLSECLCWLISSHIG